VVGRAHESQTQLEGIAAQLSRPIVIGPIARLELTPSEDRDMGLHEGDLLVLTPRSAWVLGDAGERGFEGTCLSLTLTEPYR